MLGVAQLGTAQPSTARHGTARHGTARHGTARHGTARHSAAQHRLILLDKANVTGWPAAVELTKTSMFLAASYFWMRGDQRYNLGTVRFATPKGADGTNCKGGITDDSSLPVYM